jgi:hypothetical protein
MNTTGKRAHFRYGLCHMLRITFYNRELGDSGHDGKSKWVGESTDKADT